MKGFMEEFKQFIAKGNVMDMAVGVIIGGAFTAIVNSLVGDIIQPLIAGITGGTFRRSEQMVKDAIFACLAGDTPANIVNA